MLVQKYGERKNLLERSIWASDCNSFALSDANLDNFIKPNPATFNWPPESSKIFLAPYQDFKY